MCRCCTTMPHVVTLCLTSYTTSQDLRKLTVPHSLQYLTISHGISVSHSTSQCLVVTQYLKVPHGNTVSHSTYYLTIPHSGTQYLTVAHSTYYLTMPHIVTQYLTVPHGNSVSQWHTQYLLLPNNTSQCHTVPPHCASW